MGAKILDKKNADFLKPLQIRKKKFADCDKH